MVDVAERIWPAWRAQAEQFDEPAILLLFAPAGEAEPALHGIADTVAEFGPDHGEWSWVRVPEGILVTIVECDDFEATLPRLADALRKRGVEGRFDLHDWPAAAKPPHTAELLECRLRIGGERRHEESVFFDWLPSGEAVAAVAGAAARWCCLVGPAASLTLNVDVSPDIPLERGVDAVARLREAAGDSLRASLFAVAPDRFRIASVHSEDGRASLVEGGTRVARGAWRDVLAEQSGFLREHAALVVYGFIKRGTDVMAAWLDHSLVVDWLPRPDVNPPEAEIGGAAFQDAYAPDAFGVQFLGPGYAGRVPEGGPWRREEVGELGTLLEHDDAAAWFEAPFYRRGRRGPAPADVDPPKVLREARAHLAPILFTEDVPRRASA